MGSECRGPGRTRRHRRARLRQRLHHLRLMTTGSTTRAAGACTTGSPAPVSTCAPTPAVNAATSASSSPGPSTGGVDIVQLRDKGSAGGGAVRRARSGRELAILARLRDITHAGGALLSVNDRADLAKLSGADVLHVGQGDLTPAQARGIVGEDVIIGQSTHDAAQAAAAAADRDVDYFCVGPCWPTPTKPGRTAPGLGLVREVAASAPAKAWFAIGGIDAQRLPEVVDAGARRIVVVRGHHRRR